MKLHSAPQGGDFFSLYTLDLLACKHSFQVTTQQWIIHSNPDLVACKQDLVVGDKPGRAMQVLRRQRMCCSIVLHLSITCWDEIVSLVIPLCVIWGDVNSSTLPQQHTCCDLSPYQNFSWFPTETQHQPRAATKINSALISELRTLTKTAANLLNFSILFLRKSLFVSLLSYGDFVFHSAQRWCPEGSCTNNVHSCLTCCRAALLWLPTQGCFLVPALFQLDL